ncbi:hypothetical protein PMAYCL1PPCAC_21408, partial [Pristionchus mayeri]
ITSPGFPYTASTPCDYYLMVDEGKKIIILEANSCCDKLVLTDNYIGGTTIATLTGEVNNEAYNTTLSNFMRVSWQPKGGVNVRGMMVSYISKECLKLKILFGNKILNLRLAYGSSCPAGFDLVSAGQCRGLYTTMDLYWDHRAVNTAIEKCKEVKSLPPIIHNEEQQQYWKARGWLLIALVCSADNIGGKWKWTDGSAVNYRPPSYHPALDLPCKGGCSWDIKADGYWDFVCNSQTQYTTKIYCEKQLPPLPTPAPDGCFSFEDDKEDRMCYQVANAAENWQDAQQICKSFGADLASIHNSQENNFVRRLAVSKGATSGVYLGGTISQAGVKGWIDGSRWDYDNFYPGFPMPNLGSCIAMDTQGTSGQWVNTMCSTKQGVACERKQNYNNTIPKCSTGPFQEGDIITSPGYPFDASTPCDFILSVDSGRRVEVQIIQLEANSCCDRLVLTEGYIGGTPTSSVTGDLSNKAYRTTSSNFMRVSWQPKGAVNVRGLM